MRATMDEKASAVVIELAARLVELMGQLEPKWSKAFFRYCQDGSSSRANGSYVVDQNALLLNTIKNSSFFASMNADSQRLLQIMSKDRAVFLLTVDSGMSFDVKFEFENMERWIITKLNGGTGIPEGL
jgi:hypothetical protein